MINVHEVTVTIVGRGFLTPYFMKTPPILHTHTPAPFQILSDPPFPLPPISTPTVLFVVLFLWQNGWSRRIWCSIWWYYWLHMSHLGTFVPEGPCCVFYARRRQVYWGLTHMAFCWYSNLISNAHTYTHTQTQRHTVYTGANRMMHSYK